LASRAPAGYVLNCDRSPSDDYVILHRADCHTIDGRPARGKSWTEHYQKVCADSIAESEDWARSKT
jgi:hypothetical protein